MQPPVVALMIAGTLCGAAAGALFLGGWLGLAPYPAIVGGCLLIAAAAVGIFQSRRPD